MTRFGERKCESIMTGFRGILDHPDILDVPPKMRPFFARGRSSDEMQNWGAFAFGFSAAFDELYAIAALASPRRDYLWPPVAHLARHSIELSLKEAIAFLAERSGQAPSTNGHALMPLWRHMIDQTSACGFSTEGDWTAYCGKLVKHFDDLDRSGQRFRYPSDATGQPFRPTAIELEGLAKAHHHVTRYCDATVSMVDAGGNPYS